MTTPLQNVVEITNPARRESDVARQSAYLVVVLAAAYFLAFLDRQSLALFVVPIERDLRMSDAQMGLLLGAAFGILYAVLGVPFGAFADRVNRRRLVVACIACWSVATLISALASGATQLFIGRVFVGIGEAALAPAAASMIADSFAPTQRGRAYGVFSLGTTFGAGSASLLGAGVITVLAGRRFHLPMLGTLHAWQVTLLIVALAGVPIIAAALAMREPPRTAAVARNSLRSSLRHVGEHWCIYGLIILTNVLASLMAYAFYPWIPAAMQRFWHVDLANIGVHLGLMSIVLAGTGIYLSGWLADRLQARGANHAVAAIGAPVFVLLALIAALIFRMPSVGLTWTMIGLYILLVHIYFPFALLALSIVTPPSAMALVAALNFMFTGILGLSLGPMLVVAFSTAFFTGPQATGYAISAVCATLALLGALTYTLLLRPLKHWVQP